MLVLYWGCWDGAGHYLWFPSRRTIQNRYEAQALKVPHDHNLDGTAIFLPFPERLGKGALTYLPANDRTVYAWWGNNPWDRRPGVNSAIITEGNVSTEECWERLQQQFPLLTRNLNSPIPSK